MLKSSNNHSQRDIAQIYLIFHLVKANNDGSKCILSTRTHQEPSLYKKSHSACFSLLRSSDIYVPAINYMLLYSVPREISFSFLHRSSFSCLSTRRRSKTRNKCLPASIENHARAWGMKKILLISFVYLFALRGLRIVIIFMLGKWCFARVWVRIVVL